jgi:hypothetical protein
MVNCAGDAVTPAGKPESVKLTPPPKSVPLTLTVKLADVPGDRLTMSGCADTVKFGGGVGDGVGEEPADPPPPQPVHKNDMDKISKTVNSTSRKPRSLIIRVRPCEIRFALVFWTR